VASLNLSSLMEAFALAAGIPPYVWRTVSNHPTATAQSEAPMKKGMLKENSNTWATPVHGPHSGRKS
jgi:hypothetical protein